MAERAAHFGRFHVDVPAQTVSWSAGAAYIFGRRWPVPATLSLVEHMSFYHPDDSSAFRRLLQPAPGDGDEPAVRCFRGRIVRPDGEIRHVLVQGSWQHDSRGQPLVFSGIFVDVTESVWAKQAAQERDLFLQATLQAMDQGILMVGADQIVRFHNKRARDLLGLPSHLRIDGASFDDLLAFQDRNGEFAALSPEQRARLPIALDRADNRSYTRRRPNGTVLEIRTSPLPGGGFARTYTDVSERHRRDAAVAESERRFRLLAENTTDTVILNDLDGTRRYVSPAAKALFGYDPEELVGIKPLEHVHPEDAPALSAVLSSFRSGDREKATTRQRYRRKDGSYVWVEISHSLIRDPETNRAIGWVGAVRDISGRKAVEDALRLSEQRLAFALDSTGDGLWSHDLLGDRVVVLGRWWSIIGYAEHEIEPTLMGWHKHTHPDDRAAFVQAMTDHLQGRSEMVEVEYRVRTKSGAYVWTLARGKIAAATAGKPTLLIGTYQNITQRKDAELALARMAHHDSLTGLPTRAVLQERLRREIAAVEQHGGTLAVLVCDLDRFKGVNDMLGHAAGDHLLRIVAQRFGTVLGPKDVAARVGGDEFTILLTRSCDGDAAFATARRLIAIVAQPIDLSGHLVEIGVSIGIAFGNVDGHTAEELCARADMAMYVAKASGRSAFRAYEAGMDRLLGRLASVESPPLKKAVGWV